MNSRFCVFFLAVICPLVLSLPAFAEEGPPLAPGMRQMTVIPVKPAAQQETPATETKPAAEKPAPTLLEQIKARPVLKPEDALKKAEDFRPWPYLPQLLSSSDDAAVNGALKEIADKPELAPPRALFYASAALAKQQRMEDAALYYYAAQLRARFDSQRFPDTSADSPHQSLGRLALQLGQDISAWTMKDATRLSTVMNAVREWDQRTAYAYDPGYTPVKPAAYDRWAKILEENREKYFMQTGEIADGLKKLQQNR